MENVVNAFAYFKEGRDRTLYKEAEIRCRDKGQGISEKATIEYKKVDG